MIIAVSNPTKADNLPLWCGVGEFMNVVVGEVQARRVIPVVVGGLPNDSQIFFGWKPDASQLCLECHPYFFPKK